MVKKIMAVFAAAALAVSAVPVSFAEDGDINAVVSVEKFTLGAGYIVEPELITVPEGSSASDAVFAIFEKNGIDAQSPSYLTKVEDSDTEINVPKQIVDALGGEDYIDEKADPNYLAMEDYTVYGGWMYTVNNVLPSVGMSDYALEDNAVIRVQFSAYGWGEDLLPVASFGYCPEMTGVEFADKTALTAELARFRAAESDEVLKDCATYNEALNTAATFGVSQSDVDSAKDALAVELEKRIDLRNAYLGAQSALRNGELKFGNEWNVIALARGEYNWLDSANTEYYNAYYNSVADVLKTNNGILNPSWEQPTDYARTAIALTAIGRDASDVDGYNLFEKLADFDTVSGQGINAIIYTLIALDTNGYEVPATGATNPVTRDKLVNAMLEAADENGAWGFFAGSPDEDMPSMSVQALAPYYNKNENVKTVLDKTLAWLSSRQLESGGYASWGKENSCSAAQVLTALCALGIDPDTDSRFIKNGVTIPQAIEAYAVDGGFSYELSDMSLNTMANQQVTYALASYYRVKSGKTSLYDMSDVTLGTQIIEGEDGSVKVYSSKKLNGDIIFKNADGSVKITGAEIQRGETSLDADGAKEIYIWSSVESMLPLCDKWSRYE